MLLEYSFHWRKKRRKRSEITDDLLEYCIQRSQKIRDRDWAEVWNALVRIPPSGRLLKVVYKARGKTIKILTAYWLD